MRRVSRLLIVLAWVLRCAGLVCTSTCPAMAGDMQLRYAAALPPECAGGSWLQMMDPRFGWLSNGMALWRTRNAGESWQQVEIPPRSTGDFFTIQFASEERGWLFTRLQKLYETSDGGAHWTAIDLPKLDGVITAAWLVPEAGLVFLAGGVSRPSTHPDAPNYAIERYGPNLWGILHPIVFSGGRDGTDWKEQHPPSCGWSVNALKFWDAKRGVAVGECLFYTETGGERWAVARFHTASGDSETGDHPTFFFLDRDNGWLGLDNTYLNRTKRGTTYRTKDGGKNWYRIGATDAPFDSLLFLNPTHGLGIARSMELYETTDAGVNWRRVNTEFYARSLAAVDEKNVWVLSDTALYRVTWP